MHIKLLLFLCLSLLQFGFATNNSHPKLLIHFDMNGTIIPVSTLQAILDDEYYIKLLSQASLNKKGQYASKNH